MNEDGGGLPVESTRNATLGCQRARYISTSNVNLSRPEAVPSEQRLLISGAALCPPCPGALVWRTFFSFSASSFHCAPAILPISPKVALQRGQERGAAHVKQCRAAA